MIIALFVSIAFVWIALCVIVANEQGWVGVEQPKNGWEKEDS